MRLLAIEQTRSPQGKLRLRFDSGEAMLVLPAVVADLSLRPGMDIRMMATGAEYKIVEVGYLHPNGMIPADALGAGEVGYLTASIKTVADTRVGDTVTGVEDPCSEPLPGYKAVQPMVYSGVYPADGSKYGDLRDALEKLKLNDASMSYTQEFHCARLRLPLRLFGPAAYGDHHGAARARIQPRPHHDRAERRLPHHEDERRDH